MKHLRKFNESVDTKPTAEEIEILLSCGDGDLNVGEINQDCYDYYKEEIDDNQEELDIIKKYFGWKIFLIKDKHNAEHDFDYTKFKLEFISPDNKVYVIKGKESALDNRVKSIKLKDYSKLDKKSEDIKGLTEIKQTLTSVLKYKYDNDNNAIEDQISWLEKYIKKLSK